MGNAFTAVADDLTATFWNPAGLAALRSPELYLSYKASTQKHDYDLQSKVQPADTWLYNYNFRSHLNQVDFFSVSAPARLWKRPLHVRPELLPLYPLRLQGLGQRGADLSPGPLPPQKHHGDLRGQRRPGRPGLLHRRRPERSFLPGRHHAAVLRLGQPAAGAVELARGVPQADHRENAGPERHRRPSLFPVQGSAPGPDLAQRAEKHPRHRAADLGGQPEGQGA